MSEHELVMELDRCGVRANPRARAKLAKDLSERGVMRADIALAYQHLVERRDHQPARASSILATLLADGDAWQGFLAEVHAAQHANRFGARGEAQEAGKALRSSPQEQRVREYRAAGLSDAEARLVASGGYAHARIVGDGAKPADVAKEVGLDPFEAIHAAAHWADLFGQGRAALRKALGRAVKVGLAADSLLEEMEHCPVRSLDGEKPQPILTGWRAHAPKPTQPSVRLATATVAPISGQLQTIVRAARAGVTGGGVLRDEPKVTPKPPREDIFDTPVYGEVRSGS